jgi:perosamine synthetase
MDSEKSIVEGDNLMNVPFLRPPLGDGEINAVTQVMRTTALSSGPARNLFEDRFRKYIGVPAAVAVCNGTVALDLIWQVYLRNGGLRKGDYVLCPSFTFVATANSIVNAGLVPIFCDISRDTWNIDVTALPDELPKIKAILVVHTFGCPASMELIRAFALRRQRDEMIIVEDCAEACGARIGNQMVGSFGDAAAFSFNTTKNMTTGEGGMVVFKDIYETKFAGVLKEHGFNLTRNAIVPGYNYRLSNIQAAIGLEQLKTLEERNSKRQENAKYLTERLMDLQMGIEFQQEWDNCSHVYQIYGFLVPHWIDREKILKYLVDNGVEAKNYFWPPIHCQQAYFGKYGKGRMNTTDNISSRVICLPFDDKLSTEEMDYMVGVVGDVIKR